MLVLPFRPQREGFLPAFTFVLLLLSFGVTVVLFSGHPQKQNVLVSNILFDAALHVVMFLALRQELVFDFGGINRLSGLRRHRIEYNDIEAIELGGNEGQTLHSHWHTFLYLHTKRAGAPTIIRFSFFEPDEGQKMLQILREHAPQARWNDAATRALQSSNQVA